MFFTCFIFSLGCAGHEDTLKFRMLIHQGSSFSCLFTLLLPLAAVDSQLNNAFLSWGEYMYK